MLRTLSEAFGYITASVACWKDRAGSAAAAHTGAMLVQQAVDSGQVPEHLIRFHLEVAQCARALANGEWVVYAAQRFHFELMAAIEGLEQLQEATQLVQESRMIAHGESLHEVLRRMNSAWAVVHFHAPWNRALLSCRGAIGATGDAQRRLLRSWSTEATVWVYEPTTEAGREFGIRAVPVRVPVYCENENYAFMVWRAASTDPVCNPELWCSVATDGIVVDVVVDYPPFNTALAPNHAASTLLGTDVRGTVCFVARHALSPYVYPLRVFVEGHSGSHVTSRMRDVLVGVKLHRGRLSAGILEMVKTAGVRAASRHALLFA